MHDITYVQGDVKTSEQERLLKPAAFAIVDKNLLNYPLARDTRVKLQWYENQKTGRYWAYLPGDERIKLSFPADAKRRCPNGLDINVLFFLLAEVRKQGQQTITLPSLGAILKQLGLSYDTGNLHRLNAAIELWSCISIRYEEYYAASSKGHGGGLFKKGRPVVKRFQSPIASRKGARLTIGADWCEQQDKYVERLVLPFAQAFCCASLAGRAWKSGGLAYAVGTLLIGENTPRTAQINRRDALRGRPDRMEAFVVKEPQSRWCGVGKVVVRRAVSSATRPATYL